MLEKNERTLSDMAAKKTSGIPEGYEADPVRYACQDGPYCKESECVAENARRARRARGPRRRSGGGGGAFEIVEYEVSRPGSHARLSFEDKEAARRYAMRIPGATVHPVTIKAGRPVPGSRQPDIAYVDPRRWASELGGGGARARRSVEATPLSPVMAEALRVVVKEYDRAVAANIARWGSAPLTIENGVDVCNDVSYRTLFALEKRGFVVVKCFKHETQGERRKGAFGRFLGGTHRGGYVQHLVKPTDAGRAWLAAHS